MKMKAPEGATSITLPDHGEITVENGFAEIPDDAAHLAEAHGYEAAQVDKTNDLADRIKAHDEAVLKAAHAQVAEAVEPAKEEKVDEADEAEAKRLADEAAEAEEKRIAAEAAKSKYSKNKG